MNGVKYVNLVKNYQIIVNIVSQYIKYIKTVNVILNT